MQTITKTPEIRYGNSYHKYQLWVKPNCINVAESLDFIIGGTNLMQVYYQFDFDVLFLTCNFIKKMRPGKGNFWETLINFSVCNIIKNKTPTRGFIGTLRNFSACSFAGRDSGTDVMLWILRTFQPITFLKIRLRHRRFFEKFGKKFKKTYFVDHLLTGACNVWLLLDSLIIVIVL